VDLTAKVDLKIDSRAFQETELQVWWKIFKTTNYLTLWFDVLSQSRQSLLASLKSRLPDRRQSQIIAIILLHDY
jgi:hypothetical protein